MQSQKMAKRVDGQVELRSLLAFGAVISCASAALRGRAQGPAVDDDGGWLRASARCKPQDDAQVLSQKSRSIPLSAIAAPAGRRSPMASMTLARSTRAASAASGKSIATTARPRWARPIPLILPSRRACSPSCAPTNTEPGQRRSRASQGVAWAEATRSGSPNQGPRNANATRIATPMRATVRPSQST